MLTSHLLRLLHRCSILLCSLVIALTFPSVVVLFVLYSMMWIDYLYSTGTGHRTMIIHIYLEHFVVVCYHRAYVLFLRPPCDRGRNGDILDANADRLEDSNIPCTSYLADHLRARRPCGAIRRLSVLD